MKATSILCLIVSLGAPQVAAFVVSSKLRSAFLQQLYHDETSPVDGMDRPAGFAGLITTPVNDDNSQDTLLDRMVVEWSHEAQQLAKYEQSIESDAYLADVLDHHVTPKVPNKTFMEKELHRHDSLADEVEHSIDTDPYLAFFTDGKEEEVNRSFRRQDKNRHDSLLHGIQHAVESDPDLDGITK